MCFVIMYLRQANDDDVRRNRLRFLGKGKGTKHKLRASKHRLRETGAPSLTIYVSAGGDL